MALKRVAIVGAGPSGLVAAKTCVEAGLAVCVFERRSDIGGVWNHDKVEGVCYDNLTTNSSAEMTMFSDLAFSDRKQRHSHPHHSVILKYLQRYCRQFDLRRHIHFGHEVTCARVLYDRKTGTKQCRVEWRDAKGEYHNDMFDALMVCSGRFALPNVPDISGLSKIRWLHSSKYRSPRAFDTRDAPVVVVGIGNSALDIAMDLADAGRTVLLSHRSGAQIIPARFGNTPIDHIINARAFAKLPSRARYAIFDTLCNKHGYNRRLQRLGLRKPSKDRLQRRFSIVKDPAALIAHVESGRVQFVGPLRSVRDNTHVVCGDKTVRASAVILCTGFQARYRYLSQQDAPVCGLDASPLFQHMIPLTQHPRGVLFFLGHVDANGSVPVIAEAQARYAVGVLTGRLRLPSARTLAAAADAWWDRFGPHRSTRPKYAHFVSFLGYMDGLAALCRCSPPLPPVDPVVERWIHQHSKHPRSISEGEQCLPDAFPIKFWMSPAVGAHYRLAEGGGSSRNAERIIAAL